MRHVSAEMLEAGQAALQRVGKPAFISGHIALRPFKLSAALTAVFRAMSEAGAGRDRTCAERSRRYKARKRAARQQESQQARAN